MTVATRNSMVLRLSVFLYILPPVLFAWYLQSTPESTLIKLTRRLTPFPSAEERQALLSDLEEPFSFDWQHLFQDQKSFYSRVNIMENDNGIPQQPSSPSVVHVIVLVHGWLGNPLEMDSIKESLVDAIDQQEKTSHHDFIVHSAVCNDGKTTDGIVAGGKRLAAEINSLLRFVVHGNPNASVTLSICGNSLGGLYARRALADIDWTVPLNDSKENDENQATTTTPPSYSTSTSINPLLFVTTATPHLGVSQHTYIRLPRAVEYPIAQILDQTGRDLFRFSNVLEEMTYDDAYIEPLQNFQQRIAYANVYGTDFQVPTPTAAFWALDSDSPHEVVDVSDDKTNNPPDTVVLTLQTPQRPPPKNNYNIQHTEQDPTKRFQEWSQQLDRLGWTKVLVDVREHVPQVSVWSSSTSSGGDDASTSSNKSWSNKPTWTAHELLKEFGTGLLATATLGFSGKMRIPLGHTVMVANAKDKLNKWLTIGGKPVMNWLAASMVQSTQRLSGRDQPDKLTGKIEENMNK
ncbi:DUF676 putative serine esterase domain containing protein [Nitzschia inconspicua]|uniref:DUF676 putative serine esterase domain containing protein n=1 Tax=Nitzschia inconspicua TaxID=303405 RepID=A0A9K3PN55_9STRA|nr:DUF676 putative serine esterase domain containing protein [Nitzschia inconspicua]